MVNLSFVTEYHVVISWFSLMVKCPDVFDFRAFEASMRSVFGNECVTVYKCTM